MPSTLKVNFAGVAMPNPFMLSSAPPTTNVEMVARCFEAGWGGAVLKTLAYQVSQAQNVNPRITAVRSADNEILGFTNFELGAFSGAWRMGKPAAYRGPCGGTVAGSYQDV